MKYQKLRLLAFLGVLLVCATSALAQSDEIRVKIPFAFSIGHQQLPAGEYILQPIFHGRLLLRTPGGKAITTFGTLPRYEKIAQDTGKLTFRRYNNRYFLAQVWIPDQVGRELFKSPDEMELARKQPYRQIALLIRNR